MSRLFIYDTSNFTDFPIGGQLTSIHNFLHYIADTHPERMADIILVGLTLHPEQVGRMQRVTLFGHKVRFFPVITGEADLNHTEKSVRVRYVKGLLRHIGALSIRRSDINYINTPEACGAIVLRFPWAKCLAFSHQNYFEMRKSFRFFQDSPLVLKGFDAYIKWMLRRMKCVFVLNAACENAYAPYCRNTVRVVNSIILPQDVSPQTVSVHRLLYVGRLSANKRIDTIIEAVRSMPEEYTLCIIGDGEEREHLLQAAGTDAAGFGGNGNAIVPARIRFTGALPPEEVHAHLRASDILILNSVYEGLPMTILEAMSYALPVVTTAAGGIAEAVRFGTDAVETDGSAPSIRDAIRQIEAAYAAYSAAALDNAKRYDYRIVNALIYDTIYQVDKMPAR